MDPRPPDLDAYRRTRRFAYGMAAVSLCSLLLWTALGGFPDSRTRPLVIPAGNDLLILSHLHRGEQEDTVQSVARFDPATLATRDETILFGGVTAAAADRSGAILFYGKNWSRLDAGKTDALPQPWAVTAAAGDPAGAWCFGVDDGSLRAFRLENGSAGPVETVGPEPAGPLRLAALILADGEPALLWSGAGDEIRMARRTAGRWSEPSTAGRGSGLLWAPFVQDGALRIISIDASARTLFSLPLSIATPGAPAGSAPVRFTISDSLLTGRLITGIAAAALPGGRVCVCIARPSQLMAGFLPDAGSPAAPIFRPLLPVPPLGRLGSLLFPFVMSALAVSLIYSGFAMIRERERILLAAIGAGRPAAETALRPARMLHRLMAFMIDLLVLMPVQIFALEWFDFGWLQLRIEALALPLGRDFPVETLQMSLIGWVLHFAYFSLAEGLTGGYTLGKRLLGLRATRLDGRPIDMRHALARNAGRLLDVYLLTPLVGGVVMLLSPGRRRIGDWMGRTMVQERRSVVPLPIDLPDLPGK